MHEITMKHKFKYPDNLKTDLARSPFRMGSVDIAQVEELFQKGIMSERERDIVENGYKEQIPDAVLAQKYSVTPERIRQLRNIGLAKIRNELKRISAEKEGG